MSSSFHRKQVQTTNIPRAQGGRLKNWKCTYPGCNEPAKTRYNCYSHIWDTHLRYKQSERRNELASCYKDIKNKETIKIMCDKYMSKLVEVPYPFEFEMKISNKSELSVIEEQMPNGFFNQNNDVSIIMNESYPIKCQEIPIKEKDKEEDINEQNFIEIIQMSQALKQLHVIGEIFAENGFLTRSDQRTKTDIANLNNSLDLIMQLRGVTFKYKGTEERKYGFIAQELKQVIPDLVREDEKGLYIDTQGILPILVESLKELNQNVEEYKNQNNEILELQERVDKAMDHLYKLKTENDNQNKKLEKQTQIKEINKKKKENPIWYKIRTLLGPPPFILFACLFSTFFIIVIPIIFRSFYFLIAFFGSLTIILWFVVALNWKDIKIFLKEGKSFIPSLIGWKIHQYVVWFILFSLFIDCAISNMVIGQYVFIFVGLYSLAAFLTLSFTMFISNNAPSCVPIQFLLIPLVLVQAVGIALLVLSIVYQPFNENLEMNKPLPTYDLVITENTYIDLPLLPVSWNCFNSKFRYEPELPDGISLNYDKIGNLPRISGIVKSIDYNNQSTIEINIDAICSGYIVIKYPKVILHNCAKELDISHCIDPKCSYCNVTSNSSLNRCFPCTLLASQLCQKDNGISSCSIKY
ncbi:hypothetical protein EDI_344700 [Entamoeba dispar SAW760]|uniref:Peptidase S74 domain-containing protein n=1 Tax=Entamoeba dispar (strain ATCC PRA-260 / SAW760) TaxID=370354 RepID=B0EDY5_ENTDS|nr:uncharacterized protein EDI_344700 [Entamoeba dispar SAW760]EDR27264.1 hypothetical protein EDI_344700 [Entamoeba dispar SAW760]|eukprot:EDR27264.1 hypothetical protein EDI_344700 [Entamoeba dispar SAW760]